MDAIQSDSWLCFSLQGSELDVVLGIKNILKSVTALKSLARQDALEWPTVKFLKGRIKEDSDEKTYQGATLKSYSQESQDKAKEDALRDLALLDEKMRERLSWSDTTLLLRSLLVVLETQTWMKRTPASSADSLLRDDEVEDCSLDEVKEAVEHISTHFRLPLEAKGVSFVSLQDKIEEVVDYARSYLNISETTYKKVWYKLSSCPDARKWPNIVVLELAFSLPCSNGRVEQNFSCLKVLKTDRRTSMQKETLNYLLEVYIEGPPLSSFDADSAIELWWNDCSTTRRINQQPRKEYQSQQKSDMLTPTHDSEPEEQNSLLDQWDEWFDSGSEES